MLEPATLGLKVEFNPYFGCLSTYLYLHERLIISVLFTSVYSLFIGNFTICSNTCSETKFCLTTFFLNLRYRAIDFICADISDFK